MNKTTQTNLYNTPNNFEPNIKQGNKFMDRLHTKYQVDTTTGCWNWIGTVNSDGYGVIWIKEQKQNRRATRVMMQVNSTPIPQGLHALHKCDNPLCVNPAHLRAGTQQENLTEAVERKRYTNAATRRCEFFQKMTQEEFDKWVINFNRQSHKKQSNLTLAIKYRNASN